MIFSNINVSNVKHPKLDHFWKIKIILVSNYKFELIITRRGWNNYQKNARFWSFVNSDLNASKSCSPTWLTTWPTRFYIEFQGWVANNPIDSNRHFFKFDHRWVKFMIKNVFIFIPFWTKMKKTHVAKIYGINRKISDKCKIKARECNENENA